MAGVQTIHNKKHAFHRENRLPAMVQLDFLVIETVAIHLHCIMSVASGSEWNKTFSIFTSNYPHTTVRDFQPSKKLPHIWRTCRPWQVLKSHHRHTVESRNALLLKQKCDSKWLTFGEKRNVICHSQNTTCWRHKMKETTIVADWLCQIACVMEIP